MRYCKKNPYNAWIKEMSLDVQTITEQLVPKFTADEDMLELLQVDQSLLTTYQKIFGYTSEKLDMLVFTIAKTHHEPLGSMGVDVPLACLSKLPRSPYDYLYQLFAQATNPAIDPLREANVMSLKCAIGPEGNLLATDKEACARLVLEEPLLSPEQFTTLTEVDDAALERFPVAVIDITYERADDTDYEEMKAGQGKRSVNWRARPSRPSSRRRSSRSASTRSARSPRRPSGTRRRRSSSSPSATPARSACRSTPCSSSGRCTTTSSTRSSGRAWRSSSRAATPSRSTTTARSSASGPTRSTRTSSTRASPG
jgi:hypothetical protein